MRKNYKFINAYSHIYEKFRTGLNKAKNAAAITRVYLVVETNLLAKFVGIRKLVMNIRSPTIT